MEDINVSTCHEELHDVLSRLNDCNYDLQSFLAVLEKLKHNYFLETGDMDDTINVSVICLRIILEQYQALTVDVDDICRGLKRLNQEEDYG